MYIILFILSALFVGIIYAVLETLWEYDWSWKKMLGKY